MALTKSRAKQLAMALAFLATCSMAFAQEDLDGLLDMDDAATQTEAAVSEAATIAEDVKQDIQATAEASGSSLVEAVVLPAEEEAVADAVESAEAPVAPEAVIEPESTFVEATVLPAEEPVATANEEAPVALEEASIVPAEEAEPAEVDISDEIKGDIEEVRLMEEMRRKALDSHGLDCLVEARKQMQDGNYTEAINRYEEALKYIIPRDDNALLVDEAKAGIPEAYYRQANALFKKGVLEDAIQAARKAHELNHPKARSLMSEIEEEQNNPKEKPRPREVVRWQDRDFKKLRAESKRRILKAREYYLTGEYALAQQELEIVLKNDPSNADAITMLRRVNERSYDFASDEFATTRARMIREVRDSWTPDRYALEVSDADVSGDEAGTVGTPVAGNGGRTQEEIIAQKMKDIVIPDISFRQANIQDVINFFIDASTEYDSPDTPPEQKGINFILKLANAQQPAEVAEDDPFAAQSATSSSSGVAPVNFQARYMSIYDALKHITDLNGLKFRVTGNVVVVMPMNMADVNMVTRSYTVLPAIQERASGVSKSLSVISTEDNSFGDTSVALQSSPDAIDWKGLFAGMGVNWPDGSTITYLPSINKMRVFNTPENLVEFEQALQELNVTPRQVEIEARFVEVSQTDLESLGFEWLLSDDWEIAQNKNDPSQRIKMSAGSGSAGLRYLTDPTAPAITLNPVKDSVATIGSVLTNPEINFVLHALSERSNTDLLSAPKVVTMDNQEAVIKVVTEYIYPTEYDLQEYESSDSDSDNTQNVYPSVEPGGFEAREVGVILQVIPEVAADGQLIYLKLNPQIISEPEWEDYGFEYPMGKLDESTGEMRTYHVAMRQPLFKVRSIATNIAIYNGATVVMGGMITENRTEIDDKVPFLGDIPLIGRLFRSKIEQSEKRNLLIFVTARMVDPAGRTVRTESAKAGK